MGCLYRVKSSLNESAEPLEKASMSCSSLAHGSAGIPGLDELEWLGVASLIVFRQCASEFRTSAGSASCMACRLSASLSVMSRDQEKFPQGKRVNAETQRAQRFRGEVKLGADRGAEGVGEGLAEALDVGVMLGFDHDASEHNAFARKDALQAKI